MVLISPSPSPWPQVDKVLNMASNGTTTSLMEKPTQQQQQQALKCPRCDSSNTKFCYYNNYSLSQPRHFCKACKRYWTRGGTLRNVPVGGGCRKNKRVKRPVSSVTTDPPQPPPVPPRIDGSSGNNNNFYGLPSNPNSEMNLSTYPRFNSGSNSTSISGYDLNPAMNGLGLGFSSSMMLDGDYRNSFNLNSSLSSYASMFGSAPDNSPTMASLIASSLDHQQKLIYGGLKDSRVSNHLQGLVPIDQDQIQMKDVKMEDSRIHNRMDWINSACQNNSIEHLGSSTATTDPSLYWFDPVNLGSSVTSLI